MTAAAAPRRRREFRTDVQGLRAIAVGLVLLYHAGIPGITGGYVGVDIFFVISGFLISSHLLESLERDRRIRLTEFYARRIRRILPASLTVAVLTGVAAVMFYPPLALERVLKDGLATILYVPNIWFAIQNTDYLADHSPSPYQHYWSLGVEEQFYLFWPLVLTLLALLLRRRWNLVILGIVAIAGASLVAGIVTTHIDQPFAFFQLPTRAWELLLGAVVGAVLLRGVPAFPRWLAVGGGWGGLVLVFASATLFDDTTAFPGAAALVPTVGTAAVILFGAEGARGGPTRFLSLRPMQFIGLVSYSLYLVHWPLLVVTQAAVGEQEPLGVPIKFLLGVVLAIPLAWLLFRFVETPLRAPSSLVRRRPRVTLWGTLALTVILVAGLLGGIQWAANRDISTGETVAAAPDRPVSPPVATDFLPQNLSPSLEAVADDVPPMYDDGCHHDTVREDVQNCVYGVPGGDVQIAVFGDSHSAQWFPAVEAIAEARGDVQIRTYTKSSCPAVDVTVIVKDVPYASCDRWRDAVVADLLADPPDVVVISSYAGYALADTAEEDREAVWGAGLESTVLKLRESGSRVLVIADTPAFAAPPATCVSANATDVTVCDGAREDVLDAGLASAERTAAETATASYADLTGYICATRVCPPIIANLLVYRDVNHLTATFVRYLTPALAEQLEPLIDEGASNGT